MSAEGTGSLREKLSLRDKLGQRLPQLLHRNGLCWNGECCQCLELADALLPIIRDHAAKVARDQEVFILDRAIKATCEGCSKGLPAMEYEDQQVHYRQEIAYRTLLMRCTANHSLAAKVEGWIKEERRAEYDLHREELERLP